ncbi:RNA 3'-terminal phosphate cyclase [Halomarina litorea]|uniref:RNA 3'-terminal phosphate cyclase n=1 Tax=Halomarina litorea TaxID=2961595 RepID=UPI0020C257FC|nr:RNA 3'-terminal phosphate cyclase [Halomarina sp. BCD28]
MLDLDGAAGGGQVVRTALVLSAATGEPVELANVRGARPNPGLRPQHLAAVEALAAVCDAEVTGASEGSETVRFDPGDLHGGEVEADIGTAGSVTLLFDALLPLAPVLSDPLTVVATGGTDVKWAPPLDYIRRVKLPLLTGVGLDAIVTPDRRGFYPAGGGRVTLSLAPSSLSPIDLTDRGDLRSVEVYSTASESLVESEVAGRQAQGAMAALDEMGVPCEVAAVEYAETRSTGSVVVLDAAYGGTRAGFDALGERGVPAEDVGRAAVEDFAAFHVGFGCVDGYMADQVLPFLAFAGGEVLVPEVTDHVATHLAVLDAFGCAVERTERDGQGVLLSVTDTLG